MAANSAIEWTEATWNPITGCPLEAKGLKLGINYFNMVINVVIFFQAVI